MATSDHVDDNNRFANECPIVLNWMITKERLLNVGDKRLLSNYMDVSKIPGLKFCLSIYPNGDKEERRGDVRCYIYFKWDFAMPKNIHASWTFGIKSTQYKQAQREISFDIGGGYGGKLCTRAELLDPANNCFFDEALTIELEGIVKVRGIKRKASETSSSSLNLSEILFEKSNKDLILKSHGRDVKIHRTILSAYSTVLEKKIKALKKKNYLQLDGYSHDALKVVVEFCYERKIDDQITPQNSMDLLRFADEYQIDSLTKLVTPALIDQISKENVVECANYSILRGFKELQEHCVCFLMTLIGHKIVIKDIELLHPRIFEDLGRRSFFYNAKTTS